MLIDTDDEEDADNLRESAPTRSESDGGAPEEWWNMNESGGNGNATSIVTSWTCSACTFLHNGEKARYLTVSLNRSVFP